jgi:hypothetical protein
MHRRSAAENHEFSFELACRAPTVPICQTKFGRLRLRPRKGLSAELQARPVRIGSRRTSAASCVAASSAGSMASSGATSEGNARLRPSRI